ncbi:MAG TPA: biotin synthase BioB [Sedimentisphaerales bacterium]|nr:biotin synthase BioB [Sedimentisphaerales bacterium]
MNEKITAIAGCCLAGEQIDGEQIDVLLAEAESDLFDLLYWANKIREKFFGNKVKICSIVPGRLGGCNQDCKFCAQSARYRTGYDKTKTVSDEEILNAAEQTKLSGVSRFGIVYSGKTVSEEELIRLARLVEQIRERFGLRVCASVGIIRQEQAERLAQSGLSGYNHNLETSARHFGSIVTTHKYGDRVETIQAARKAGLRVCAGGIFGIGESDSDRVQMALELRRLGVDTVPMNFLHPIKGTPLGDAETLEPREILSIIALYRFILPRTSLKIAGGRVLNLRDMQSWMFYAGANAILSGNYLTTAGRAVREDVQMLTDLGLEVDSD